MDDTPRIAELRKKLEKDPGSRLFAQLAEELRKDGRHADAINVARSGLDKNPNYPSARLTLARALLDSGRPGDARPELVAIVKAAPDNILASRLLGEALEDLGDLSGAAQQIERTLKISPGDKSLAEKLAALKVSFTRAVASVEVVVPKPVPVALDRDLASGTFSPGSLNAQDLQAHLDVGASPELPTVTTKPDLEETLGFGAFPAAPAPPPPGGAATVLLPPRVETPSGEITPAGGAGVEPEPSAEPKIVLLAPPVAVLPAEPDGEDSDVGAQTLPLTSLTLADLYLQQGLKTEASAVLSQVLREEPENRQAQSRFAAVSRQIEADAVSEPAEHFSEAVAPQVAEFALPAPAEQPAPIEVREVAPVSARAPRTRAEISAETTLSLKAFLSAVEREAVHQRATETLIAPTGAPTP